MQVSQGQQEEYGLKDESIGLTHKNNTRGRHFQHLTKEELVTVCKLTFGEAITIIELITLLVNPPQYKFPLVTIQCLMLILSSCSRRYS